MNETHRTFFLCIKNRGYAASLQVRTVYRGLRDPEAESHGMLRIVDESGEDYLVPSALFVPIEVPEAAERVFAGAALDVGARSQGELLDAIRRRRVFRPAKVGAPESAVLLRQDRDR